MSKKITHEDYVKRLKDANPNLEVIGIYSKMKDPIEHRCIKHDIIWKTSPSSALKGAGCSKCCSEKISNKVSIGIEEYLRRLSKNNPNLELVGTYIDIKTPVEHRCKIHDFIWKISPDGALSGHGCKKCGSEKIIKSLTKTHEQYVEELSNKNPHIKVLGTYTNGKVKIEHYCTIHDITWNVAPEHILKSYGCELCSKDVVANANKMTDEEYCSRVSKVNSTVVPMEKYINMRTPILHCCTIHNLVWKVSPSSILQGGGCKKCKSERISQSNTLTDDDYRYKLNQVNPNVIPLEEYINNKTPILHKCLIHNIEWKTTPGSVLQGCGCSQCGSERISGKLVKTHEQYIEELKQINPNIEVLEEYTRSDAKILFKCKLDGFEWRTGANNVLCGTGCPKCAGNPRRTHEQYIAEVANINSNIEVIEKYINANTSIKHRCKIHNYIWTTTPTSILRGVNCPRCYANYISELMRIPYNEYIKRLSNINTNVICIGEYIDIRTPTLHKCLIDDYEWYVTPSQLLSGHGCPKCGVRFSKGEETIDKWLNSHNIKFIRQKTFEDCKDKYPLPFDFYLFNNKCIEFDGRQHFEPVEHFGGEEAYKITVLHDQIKNEYCKQNNIPLLRIPYYADIEQELENFLLAS